MRRYLPMILIILAGCASTGGDEGAPVATTFEEAQELFKSSNVDDRLEAVQFIGADRNPNGFGILEEALKDEDILVRLEASLALRNYNSPMTIPILRPLLEDKDSDLRYSAAVSLFELDDYSGVSVLVEGLDSERSDYRLTSALMLSRLRWSEAVPGLIRMLSDDVARNRSQAAYSLGQIFHARQAVEPLLETMNDPVDYVRKDAWEALKTISGQDYPFSYGADEELRAAEMLAWRRWILSQPASSFTEPTDLDVRAVEAVGE